jgi:basic membrane protein A and related proteins
VAYHSDMKKFGPKAQLVAVTHHWGAYYTAQAKAVIDGKWKSTATWGGIKAGMVKLEGMNANVPADARQLVAAREKEIVAGTLSPFAGPVKDNEGKVRLDKGVMTDEALNKMDYLVEGVVGKIAGK